MEPSTAALRVQAFFGESDQVGHTSRYEAILEYLRKQGAIGATIERGIAGFGINSKIHTASILDLSRDLPLILTWVDSRARVERALPGLKDLTNGAIVTVEEVEVLWGRLED
jgi:PII-like signaling protein